MSFLAPRATTSRRPPVLALFLVLAVITAACSSSDTTGPEVTSPQSSSTLLVEAGDDNDQVSTDGPFVARTWDIDAALAADPNCAAPVTGDPLRIGYAADLSEFGGPADFPGSQATVHLAKLINCSGGLGGRPVEVIVEDISGDPLETRTAVKRLLDAGVHALLGPPFPDPGFRVLQVTDGNIPVIFTASTEPALGDNTALSYLVAFNDTQGATVAAQFALTNGWTRAVTFSSPGPYFGYNTLVFRGVLEGRGGTILGDYEFEAAETTDFSEAVAEIALDPPDVIYSAMFAFQVVALREQLEAAGVDVKYLLSNAFEATGGYSLTGTEGIYHVTHAFPEEGSRIVLLTDSLAAAVGFPSEAPSIVALAGDAVAVIAAAYLQVRTTDPLILGEAIANLQGVNGVTGVLSYNGMGTPTKTIYIHRVVDGQPTLATKIG